EVKVRNAIIDRFLFDGNLRVAEKDQADLVLSGELIRYERYALRYTDNDDVQEYRVHVIVNLVMKDCRQNEVFWEESGFAGEATYFVSGAMATTESSALEEATVDLARRVVERTIENW
ncbi:MAG TPA: LPS assembly lipoprotein LptE, partial [Candidatus Omnitrophota bacterium]|nr:LPS assembly lipoprotein LptE [Candidatus Omnitrophota bacterium]